MIGTTLRVGFDSSQVSRGLGGLTGKMKGLFGRMGIGAMERVGHKMTDIMGRIVMAIPEAVTEAADWAGGLTDMATATGSTIEELVVLEEMLRLAGVRAKESGQVIGRMVTQIKTAAEDGGPIVDSLGGIGLDIQDLAAMKPDQMFRQIAQAIAKMAEEGGNVEGLMMDIFGQRLGYQQLKLFKDFNNVQARAALNVNQLAGAMQREAPAIDQYFDALGRIENVKRSLATIGISEFIKMMGADSADNFFDKFDPEKWRKPIADIMGQIRGTFTWIRENGGIFETLKGGVRNLGMELGEGIKESFKGLDLIPLIFGQKPSKEGGLPVKELSQGVGLLKDIKQRVGVAKWG